MGLDLGLEKERDVELTRPGGEEDIMTIPPPPPTKDLPRIPPPVNPGSPNLRASPSQPPSRPLPSTPTPTPTPRSSDVPTVPPPARPPPFKPQAPLAMNPPTRPGTAVSQISGTLAPLRFPGSTRRLSWVSIASKRPVKYGQGKHSRVELVPQPSDDADDPLVCSVACLTEDSSDSAELACLEEGAQFWVPSARGCHDRRDKDDIHDC